jgi:DNA-binding CsgD family transcriptional regulator
MLKPQTTLTPREEEIMRLIVIGHPDKQIADELKCSPHTVGTHIRRIYWKFQVNTRAAAAFAYGAEQASRKHVTRKRVTGANSASR